MLQSLITGFIAFVSTNIDDIFILMTLFSKVNGESLQVKNIVIGQYLGIIALTVLSIVGALSNFIIPVEWIGFLGLIPFCMGVKGLIQLSKNEDEENNYDLGSQFISISQNGNSVLISSTLKVAAITIGNGGDNIAVYIPIFASSNVINTILIVLVFLLLVGIWCFVGFKLVNNQIMANVIEKYGQIATPIVLVGLGIFILYDSGTFNLLLS